MSEKRLDAKNRWRNVVVAFRMSPEEAQELNVKVSLSGLSKQDYIIQCLLKHEIRVVGGMKVAKKVQVHLDTILEELQTLDESDRGIDVEELLVPLKHETLSELAESIKEFGIVTPIITRPKEDGNWKKKAYCAKRASTNDYQSRIYRHTDRCRSVCPDYLRGYSEEDCRGRHLRQ